MTQDTQPYLRITIAIADNEVDRLPILTATSLYRLAVARGLQPGQGYVVERVPGKSLTIFRQEIRQES